MKQFLIGLFLLTSFLVSGQQKVANKKFDTMLNTLLSHTVTEVTPADCKSDNIVYLDAREKEEYEVSHINDAQWAGYSTFKVKRLKKLPKDSKIVVYCTVGYRSEKVTEKLEKAGFTNVSNLYGGIFEWVHAGNKVYNNSGITEDIHTYDSDWAQWLNTGNKIFPEPKKSEKQ